jgi:hypothetical protein
MTSQLNIDDHPIECVDDFLRKFRPMYRLRRLTEPAERMPYVAMSGKFGYFPVKANSAYQLIQKMADVHDEKEVVYLKQIGFIEQ